ncbi:ABC transporter ATP-binding protein [Rhodospira trueperi]|uniref:Phospholipid/cholesterol/gamma-HCH transport system ATP-binding protein n=1 Tax=Rhodospira trueperi TaxID=69960 RepID=A0A1G7F5M3_9PROT|nr:ATP-binding cassette domain-containing protein [Rhodospira trueperi]SDE71210.1 phospholipid/cholesterol/gamma-HCH transport system ATP-binding protein [Rhodospira trueperi]
MAPHPDSAPSKISLRGVQKRFGANVVLDGIDLDVTPGESLVVIGGSGSGKSVLLKCILGLLRPDAGSIAIDGEETVGLTGRARDRITAHIGMLFQGAALFDSLPVWENVAFGLIQGRRAGRTEARARAMECLDQVGLLPRVADLYPAELSGGMQKRVGLARAIATRPDIVFFDEPTTGLDPIMADVINDLIVATTKTLGATALSITHDMASATKIGDRIAMLYRGRLIWVGPAKGVFDSDNAHVDQFVHGRADGPITQETEAK